MNIVHVGVGPISQSDVDLAQACGACIVGFNIRSPPSTISLAATHANIKVIKFALYLSISNFISTTVHFSTFCLIYDRELLHYHEFKCLVIKS